MAVTSRDLRNSAGQRNTGYNRAITGQFKVVGQPTQRASAAAQGRRTTGPLHSGYLSPAVQPQPRASRLPYFIAALLALAALALMANSLITWTHVKIDDIHYGRPRTTSLSGFVGHNEAGGVPSQFVALNVNRRVIVYELPGGDPAQTRTLTGPYLFGANEDLTPVGLRFALVNNDKLPDLIVSVKHEEIIYINENGNFRLITPEERTAYQQQLAAVHASAQPSSATQ